MRLEVVKADGGGLLDVRGCIIRYGAYFISPVRFWALWDGKHDAWHDRSPAPK
jgi:hypothetical protein